jgi:hypothetical protein
MGNAAAAYEALCAQHGVSPDNIPDRPASPKGALATAASAVTAFCQRERPRAPEGESDKERKRREKRAERRLLRRKWSGGGALPPDIRERYTQAEQAVLAVIVEQTRRNRGRCTLAVRTIAEAAGVVRRMVQYTLRKAEMAEDLAVMKRERPGPWDQTHLIVVKAKSWLDWLRRGPWTYDPRGRKNVHPYRSEGDNPQTSEPVERPQRGFQGKSEAAGECRRRR